MMNYTNNNSFYNEYLELLINRITLSTMSLEKDLGDPNDSKNAIPFKDNMRAFKLLISKKNELLTENLIIEVANIINESSMYISNGYRKQGTYSDEWEMSISSPESIHQKMDALLTNYYSWGGGMDPYEREARFHIEFIKIHPFEDGNRRTARLLLNFNLLRQGLAPVIITKDLDEYYKSYIRNESVEDMANIFRIQSTREREVFETLKKEHQDSLGTDMKSSPLK